MRQVPRILMLLAILTLLVGVAPASAHDPDDHGDHSGPGSTGPDQHTRT